MPDAPTASRYCCPRWAPFTSRRLPSGDDRTDWPGWPVGLRQITVALLGEPPLFCPHVGRGSHDPAASLTVGLAAEVSAPQTETLRSTRVGGVRRPAPNNGLSLSPFGE